jgi:predicted amidohydrolase YtcJ
VTATLMKNVMIWDGESDAPFAGEVLIEGNRIKSVAHGTNQIARDRASEVIDGGGKTLMPGLVEGHCHLSFVGPALYELLFRSLRQAAPRRGGAPRDRRGISRRPTLSRGGPGDHGDGRPWRRAKAAHARRKFRDDCRWT